MPYVIDSPRSIELEPELPRFRVPPAQYWIIRHDYKMEHSPHGLFALPAALLDGNGPAILTHWGRVTHTCVSELTIIG